MDTVIRGWRPAAQYACTSVRTLRELVAAGTVPAVKSPDGVWTFAASALDDLRTRLGTRVTDAAATAHACVPGGGDADRPLAPDCKPVPAVSAALPAWMLAACGEAAIPAPPRKPVTGHVEPPPWGVRTGPTWLDTIGDAIAQARPSAAVEQLAHERDAARADAEQLRAQLGQLQHQLAEIYGQAQQHAQQQHLQAQHAIASLQAQVAQATGNWAGERLAAIALAVECELLHSAALVGLAPQRVKAAVERGRDAAVGAIRHFDCVQLADPSALDIARSAAHAALAKLHARASRRRKHDETSAN